jgi:hypothetical protein
MRVRYLGLILDTDVPLPELESHPHRDLTAPAQLWLRRDDEPCPTSAVKWFHDVRSDDGEPWLSVGRTDEGYILEFHRLLWLHYRSPLVCWSRHANVSEESFRHILLDQALPLIAAQEGHTVLHGACAVSEGGAALFAGRAGSGKSTLVACLVAGGWRAAADDAATVVVQAGGVLVRPSYGGLRLWPDSSDALGYAGGEPVAAHSDKRRFRAHSLPDRDVPLRAVFVLRPADGESASVRDLSKRDALIALVSNTYVLDIQDRQRARSQLDMLTAVVERLPVRELTVPHRFEMLDEVRSLVEQYLPVETSR